MDEKISILKILIEAPATLTNFQKTVKELKKEMKKGNTVAKLEYNQWLQVLNQYAMWDSKYQQILENL